VTPCVSWMCGRPLGLRRYFGVGYHFYAFSNGDEAEGEVNGVDRDAGREESRTAVHIASASSTSSTRVASSAWSSRSAPPKRMSTGIRRSGPILGPDDALAERGDGSVEPLRVEITLGLVQQQASELRQLHRAQGGRPGRRGLPELPVAGAGPPPPWSCHRRRHHRRFGRSSASNDGGGSSGSTCFGAAVKTLRSAHLFPDPSRPSYV
jgi:hypothetical protein